MEQDLPAIGTDLWKVMQAVYLGHCTSLECEIETGIPRESCAAHISDLKRRGLVQVVHQGSGAGQFDVVETTPATNFWFRSVATRYARARRKFKPPVISQSSPR